MSNFRIFTEIPFTLKSKIIVSDRKSYCLGQKLIFQSQIRNRGDRLGPLTTRRNLRKQKHSLSINILNNLHSYLQQLFTDDNQRSEENNRVLFLFYGISRKHGSRGGLMVRVLDSGSSGPGSGPGWGH